MSHILSIAGSDPSANSGLQADLEVIRDLGHRAATVITAVTAQSDDRFYSVNAVDSKILKDQLRALLSDYTFDAIKVGLLVSNEITYQVYRILSDLKTKHIVIDPVIQSSSGSVLLESAALSTFTSFLLPLAELVTPNLDEAETLSGLTVRTTQQMEEAAKKILQGSPGLKAVLIKGGHLEGEKIDLLYDGKEFTKFEPLVPFPEQARGTGCRLSSAIACNLSAGQTLKEAIHHARLYLQEKLSK